ncbi:MAG TPA: glycoside hydrolase family 2 TIM barrel-domain containing protein [Ginsengibacter sp.]
MKKYFLFLITCCAVFFTATAQVDILQNIDARNIQNLDGRWHYIIDPYETGNNSFYKNREQQSKSDLIEYDFAKSPTLNVPGDWNSQDDQLLFYEGTIWYEHDFNVAFHPGKKYFLYFKSVNYEATVYVNGQKAGEHKGGFTPFQFDVTSLLHDGNNFVVVKANNTRRKENVPTENFDWWNYGGITGNVALAEISGTFISDYKIQLAKSDNKHISGFVQLKGQQAGQKITVGIPEANINTIIVTNDSGYADINIAVKNLHYWSPEDPRLYNVVIKSADDSVKEKIGFRTIETKGKDILLNGKSIFLRGICMHDEDPFIPGRPRNASECRMMLLWAKELNCNFIRLAHYPHNESEARLADSLGIMLWEEVPVYWSIDWDNPATYDIAQQQLSELIARDKNRAGVIVWSIGNETPATDSREKFMEKLADHAHLLDNTRLVSAALLGHINNDTFHLDDPLGKKLDVVSFNEYIGWYVGLPDEMGKYNFKIDYDKPIIITETGGGALAGFHADDSTRFSEEFQEEIYKNQVKLFARIDGLRGTTPWILVDFRSPKRLNPTYQDYWNRKGLISETGQKKKAFYVLKAFYDEMEKKYSNK